MGEEGGTRGGGGARRGGGEDWEGGSGRIECESELHWH